MPTRSTVHRHLAAIALAGAALLVALPASAGSEPTIGPHTGRYGVHQLIDSDEYPAGVCIHGTSGALKRIKVRHPATFAVDATRGLDSQLVGWRYVIEFRDAPATDVYVNWDDVPGSQSTVIKARATDATPASWASRFYTFPSDFDVNLHSRYRISYTELWYKSGSTTKVTGKAVDVPEYYKTTINGSSETVENYYGCYPQAAS